LHTKSPSPEVATTRPRRVLFFCAAADAVELPDVVGESVLSDRARDTSSSSLARFIPATMNDLPVLIISLMDIDSLLCCFVVREKTGE
jgi:hypothetical protein